MTVNRVKTSSRLGRLFWNKPIFVEEKVLKTGITICREHYGNKTIIKVK